MKHSGMYEKCNELDGYIENPYMTLQQWFIMDINFTGSYISPSIIMMRHEEK